MEYVKLGATGLDVSSSSGDRGSSSSPSHSHISVNGKGRPSTLCGRPFPQSSGMSASGMSP
jgi:hypothetical protein